MAQGRYIGDYRLIETIDGRGRVHTDYEYIGAAYGFVQDAETVRREKKLLPALCAAGWLCFVCALLPNSQAMHALYIALPFAFAALPLAILTEIACSARSAKETLERRQADKFTNRYPPAALALAILCAAALIGQIVRLILGGAFGGADAGFSLGAALLLACGVIAFARRGRLAARKSG